MATTNHQNPIKLKVHEPPNFQAPLKKSYPQYYMGTGQERRSQIIVFEPTQNCMLEKKLPLCTNLHEIETTNTTGTINTALWASVLVANPDEIYIAGGRIENEGKKNFAVINTFQIYHPLQDTYDELTPMLTKRSSFPLIQRDNYIYALAGRNHYTDKHCVSMAECERYNISTKQWEDIASLNIRRSHHGALLYKNDIYVYMGYKGFNRRTSKVEKYDSKENCWSIISELCMFAPIDCFASFPYKDHKFVVIGGNNNGNSSQGVFIIDLANNTSICTAILNIGCKQNLYAYYKENEEVWNFTENAEKIQYLEWNHKKLWNRAKRLAGGRSLDDHSSSGENITGVGMGNFSSVTISNYGHFKPDYYKNFLTGAPNFVVDGVDDVGKDVLESIDSRSSLFFGTDAYPIIYAIDADLEIMPHAIPNNLHLRKFQGVTRISENKLQLSGGVNASNQRISKVSTIFDLITRKAQRVQDMNKRRYNYPISLLGNFVYVFGGQNKEKEVLKVTKSCEKFDIETHQWSSVPDMNFERCESHCFIQNNEIYLACGYREAQRNSSIEKFNPIQNEWKIIDLVIEVGIGAGLAIPMNQFVYLCGGMDDTGQHNNTISVIDIENDRIMDNVPMKMTRLFPLCVKAGNDRIIFGGNDTAEIISLDYRPRITDKDLAKFSLTMRKLCSWVEYTKGFACV